MDEPFSDFFQSLLSVITDCDDVRSHGRAVQRLLSISLERDYGLRPDIVVAPSFDKGLFQSLLSVITDCDTDVNGNVTQWYDFQSLLSVITDCDLGVRVP